MRSTLSKGELTSFLAKSRIEVLANAEVLASAVDVELVSWSKHNRNAVER